MGPTMDIIRRLTRSFENITDYVKGHPDDVAMFARDIDMVLKVLLGVAGVAGKVMNFLPAPLRKAAEGAIVGGLAGSVIPGAGTGAGAVAGGVLGAFDGLSAPPKGYNRIWGGLSMVPDAPAAVQKQSYESGPTHMQPVNISFMVDGQVLARHVGAYQTQQASRPSPYGNAPDPIEVALRPGMPLISI